MEIFMYKREYSYEQISKSIYTDFISGKLVAGDTIPTEMNLSDYYNVSRSTVRKSIQLLIKNKVLYSVQGSGTYVSKTHTERQHYSLENFAEYAKRIGGTPSTKVLHFEVIKADLFLAQRLEIEVGDNVFHTKRIRFLDEESSEFEVTYLPVEMFPDLSYSVIETSKYNYIENIKGFTIQDSFITVLPMIASEELADVLAVPINSPIMCVRSIGSLSDGRIFEYTESYRVPERNPFQLTITRRSN